MKIEDVKILLDKFYRGETSLDEEKRLSDFFRQENVPLELEHDRKVFLSLSDNEIQVPDNMERSIASLIDSFEDKSVRKAAKIVSMRYSLIAVAASLLLVVGIGFFYQQHQKTQWMADTYKNPDEAYTATINALQLFSENFSKGVEPMEKANAHIKETQKIINKSMHTLK